jgi:integrase
MEDQSMSNLRGTAAISLTLADVQRHLATTEAVTAGQRRDRLSAINTVARWLKRTLAEIPASHALLRAALAPLTAAGVGVSPGRFANVVSLLKSALDLTGIKGIDGRGRAVLSPDWQAMVDRIDDRFARAGVMRFVRFMSAMGIAPEAVTDAAVAAYQAHLAGGDFTADAFKVTQAAVRTWNRLVAAGWSAPRLTPLRKFTRYTLTWDAVPASLVAEIEKWLTVCAGNDSDDDRTPPRPVRDATVKARRFLMLQLLSGLHHQGHDVGRLRHLADLCDPVLVKLSLRYHVGRYRERHDGMQGEVRTPTVFGIADLPRQIAKHHVGADAAVVAALTDLARRFRPAPSGMCETAERRLQQVENPRQLRALLRHPIVEMYKLAKKTDPHRLDAGRFAVLLAIGLLTVAPVRIKNAAALDLDAHVHMPSGKQQPLTIAIPRTEVKNGRPFKFKLTVPLAELFRIYLRKFRPLLLRGPSSAVFPGKGGKAKDGKLLGRQISGLLRRELGLAWNPHLFRHLAAYLLLHEGNGNYVDGQLVLNHQSGDTTRRSYEGFNAAPAFARYDRLIDEQRGPLSLRSRSPRKPKK